MRSVPLTTQLPGMTLSPSTELDAIVGQLEDSLSILSVELAPIHQRLVTIRRQLVSLAAKEGPHKAELKPLQEELRKIDSLSLPPPIHCFVTLLFLRESPEKERVN